MRQVSSPTFSYGAFGNISKSGTYSFQPTYNSATNRFASIPGVTVSYDAAGNLLSDGSHTYSWDAYGKPVTVDSVALTYDAFGRMVEQNRSGAYTPIVYSPTDMKIELMNGQSFAKAFVPVPGGGSVVYGGGTVYFGHSDHLGSIKLASTTSRTISWSLAHAPFGETYATSGTIDPAFTGQRQDTSSGLYDFPAREYSTQGRWPSPDPAGLAAVDLSDPQSWNHYSYVRNSPTNLIDPYGLDSIDPNKNPHPRGPYGGHRRPSQPGRHGTCWAAGGGVCWGNSDPFWLLNFMSPDLYWFDNEPYWGVIYSGPITALAFPGPGDIGGFWAGLKKVARKVGNYVNVPCGGGAFAYGGPRVSGAVAAVGGYKIVSVDSRTGYSSGYFTDLTVGEGVQGGLGLAKYKDGDREAFLFAGVGVDIAALRVGLPGYSSQVYGPDGKVSGPYQTGLNLDLDTLGLGGGVGVGVNFDTATSCLDHNVY